MNKFEGATKTVGGHQCKDVTFNSAIGYYLGVVADPIWAKPGHPFTTCTWTKSGKCGNKLRPELNLESPLVTLKKKVANCFRSSLGQQCNELYSTSDGRVFIRFEEADKHSLGALDPNTKPLQDGTIREWVPEDVEGIKP